MKDLDRMTSHPGRLNGQPCIRNLRLKVRCVLEALAVYPDREQLRREYPELEDEDIRQPWLLPPPISTSGSSTSPGPHETPARSGPAP